MNARSKDVSPPLGKRDAPAVKHSSVLPLPDRLRQAEGLLLSAFGPLAIVLGLVYAVLLPPLQAPDEYGHYYRAYELSEGTCIPPSQDTLPQQVVELPLLYPARLEENRRIELAEYRDAWSDKIDPRRRQIVTFLAVNGYSCIPYVGPAAAMAMGRALGGSALELLYLGRLANVLVYATLVICAMWLLPGCRPVLFCVALMPMTLHQASSLSADSLTLGVTFLLVSYVLFLAFGEVNRITVRQMGTLTCIAVVMSLCKFNVWLLFAILLIPATKLGGKKQLMVFTAIVLLVAIGATVLAQLINTSNATMFVQARKAQGIDVQANMQFVWQHPGAYALAVYHSVKSLGLGYVRQFVGTFGWLTVPLPNWSVWLYFPMLPFVACASAGPIRLRPVNRVLTLAITLACALSTFVLLWGFEANASSIREASMGVGQSPGVQGRYFIPFSFLSLLTCSGNRLKDFFEKWASAGRYFAAMVVTLVALASITGLHLIWSRYYANPLATVPWGQLSRDLHPSQSSYEGMLVRRHGMTAEDGMVFLVWNGSRRWVMDGDWLKANGFRWPQDVTFISDSELMAIPVGPPIEPSLTELPPSPPSYRSRYERRLIRSDDTVSGDAKIYVVLRGVKHRVMDSRWIVLRGFKLPADVEVVPRREFEAIPSGEAIPPAP